MDLQFLKPNRKKICIMLFLIILFLALNIYFVSIYLEGMLGINALCTYELGYYVRNVNNMTINESTDILVDYSNRTSGMATRINNIKNNLSSIFFILAPFGIYYVDYFFIDYTPNLFPIARLLIYYYIVSCVIVWIYDKVKRK